MGSLQALHKRSRSNSWPAWRTLRRQRESWLPFASATWTQVLTIERGIREQVGPPNRQVRRLTLGQQRSSCGGQRGGCRDERPREQFRECVLPDLSMVGA